MIVDISVSRCCSTISQLEAKVNEDCTAFWIKKFSNLTRWVSYPIKYCICNIPLSI